jgi:hypothetical protein
MGSSLEKKKKRAKKEQRKTLISSWKHKDQKRAAEEISIKKRN